MISILNKTTMFSVTPLLLAFFLFLPPALAIAGETVIAHNGKPMEDATITFSTLNGEKLGSAKTDENGTTQFDIPATAKTRVIVATVEDKDGGKSRQAYTQPPGKPWGLVALDTAGGIVSHSEKTAEFLKDAAKPILVGENSEVGSGAKLKEKVAEAAGSLVSGAIGSLFGGGGGFPFGGGGGGASPPSSGNSGSGDDIETVDDPIEKDSKRIFTDPASGTTIAVGTKMTPDGLLVSTDIVESPDDGTFQTIYMMDPKGRKAGPTRYTVYEMYLNWKLTVHWTKDTYINGQHVSHQEGGWSEEGSDFLGSFVVPQKKEGIWSKMGFSNAVEGIKSLGTLFPVKPGQLASQPMSLVVHITKPGEDTVTTTPFIIALASDCPCPMQQRESIFSQLDSATDPETRALQERLRAIDEELAKVRQVIINKENSLPSTRRDLEQRRDSRDRPGVSNDDIRQYQVAINMIKEEIEADEQALNKARQEELELRQQRADIENQLNEKTAEDNTGPSIWDELEGPGRFTCAPIVESPTKTRTVSNGGSGSPRFNEMCDGPRYYAGNPGAPGSSDCPGGGGECLETRPPSCIGDDCYDRDTKFINNCNEGRSCVPSPTDALINRKFATAPSDPGAFSTNSEAGSGTRPVGDAGANVYLVNTGAASLSKGSVSVQTHGAEASGGGSGADVYPTQSQ